MSEDRNFIKVVCPRCGKALPMRILAIEGSLRYSIRCTECKKVSEVEISEWPESHANAEGIGRSEPNETK